MHWHDPITPPCPPTHSANPTTCLQAMPLAAVNGLGLALVIPCAQSLIADLNPADRRGRSFGLMQMTSSLGAVAASLMATNLGGMTVMGTEGWRAAFHIVAMLSVATGYLVLVRAVDPRFRGAKGGGSGSSIATSSSRAAGPGGVISQEEEDGIPLLEISSAAEEARKGSSSSARVQQRARRVPSDAAELPVSSSTGAITLTGPGSTSGSGAPTPASSRCGSPTPGSGSKPWGSGALSGILWMLRVRTFQAIVFQGILGCIPWQAMAFTTLWLQLVGFSDFQASTILALSALGTAVGGVLGGTLGDSAAKRRPLTGRIIVAQISVASGIPFMIILLKALPASPLLRLSWAAYACVALAAGASISWTWAGCNSPIFADIVPPELLSSVYAFDRSFEGALAACAAPLVGILAESMYGFKLTDMSAQAQAHAVRQKEQSLGSGVAAAPVGGASPVSGSGDVFGADPVARAANAQALGDSMLTIMLVCWSLCLVCYTALYWTYPRDRARARVVVGGAAGSGSEKSDVVLGSKLSVVSH